MKLVGIGTVKNEADIIESFVRHNLGRLDALVLIDDGSVDGTREILLALEGEGLNLVTLAWDGSVGHEQSMKLSELLLVLTSRMNVDWVFPLDADEAIDCVSRVALERNLKKIPRQGVGIVPWRTYIPAATDDWAEINPFRRILHRKAREAPQFYKVVLPGWQLGCGPIVIATGSHSARSATGFKQLTMNLLEEVSLAHFPVRSPDQLVSKVIGGWLSMCATGFGRPSRAFHWRDMYAQFMRDGSPGTAEIERLARCYSGQSDDGGRTYSPVRMAGPSALRQTMNRRLPTFVTIAQTAEYIIKHGKRSLDDDNPAGMFHHRSSWRHCPLLSSRGRLDLGGAAAAYVDRRFGGRAQVFDDKNGPIPFADIARNRQTLTKCIDAIISVGPRHHQWLSGSRLWLEAGWCVDHTATLAVRIFATSAQIRRYAVVLVPCEKSDTVLVSDSEIPAPSTPGWRERCGLALLYCYFRSLSLFWFVQSMASHLPRTGLLDRLRVGQRERGARVADASLGSTQCD
jgi:hypothetical protein